MKYHVKNNSSAEYIDTAGVLKSEDYINFF